MELPEGYSVIVDSVSNRKIIVEDKLWQNCDNSLEFYFDNYVAVASASESLEAIRERAEINEVINFANKIRSAGGGNLIEGLMPSTPLDSNSCLIANALNFDCEVNALGGTWYMEIEDGNLGEEIAKTLGLDYDRLDDDDYSSCEITLPNHIGCVAEAFDTYCDYELEQYNEQNIARNSIR